MINSIKSCKDYLGMYKDELLSLLSRIDKHASLSMEGMERFRVVIVGGSALILCGYLSRATADIDVIQADRRLYDIMSQGNL